jgi:hypothetical protein
VKVKGPLQSFSAHGDFGKLINYHRRPSGGAVAKAHKPGSLVKSHADPSASQTTIRDYVKEAVEHWQLLTSEQQAQWNAYVVRG